MAADATNAQLTELGAALLSRGDELSDTTVALMRRDVSFHRTVALVSDDQLRATVRTHLDVILGAFGSAEHGYNTSAAAATGRSRAAASVPLPAVMDSYRICVRFPWDELQAEASRVSAAADVVLVRASSAMWTVLDEFTTAMVSGYQEEMTHQLVNRQQERSAMVQALIDGRLTDTVDLWNTADTLRISLQGPYVVVCAELAPGRPFSISERRRPAISARSFLCVAVATRYRDRSSASRPVRRGRTRADCVGRLPARSDRDQPAIRRSRTNSGRVAICADRDDSVPTRP
jgi:hypothetical protein